MRDRQRSRELGISMFHRKRAAGASIFVLCISLTVAPALAQLGPETVTVTATRIATALTNVPESMSVVTAAEIADTPAQGLDDILRNLPGMTLNDIGPNVGHPTAYNESMRGLPTTETRMLVMVDGVPVNDPFFGYIQWNRIPLDNIDHVEVVRGGGSPLWGNTAMGGVVNVITKALQNDQLEVSAAGGSYAAYNASLYGAYRASDWLTLSANASLNGTQGYQTTPPSWTSFGSPNLRSPVYTPTSNQARNVGLRGDISPAPDISGFFDVSYGEDRQILSTPIGLDKQRIWTYSGGLTKSFGDGASLSATFFHDDNNFVTNNPHLLTFTTEYNSNVHTAAASDNGASLDFTQQWNGWLRRVSVGGDYHQIIGHDLANYYAPSGQLAAPTIIGGGDQLFLAGFGQAELVPIDALQIMASLRYQYYQSSNGIDTFPPGFGSIPDVNKYRFTPRADARYRLDDALALRGAYYQSFRAPTMDQLYRTYADTTAGIFEGNPFLKPETLEGEEMGVDYNLPGLRSQFTFYTSKISNLITQRNLDPSEFPNLLGVNCGFDPVAFTFLSCTRNINAASALARGFEAETTWEIGGGFSSEWTYTYADSHYTADPVDPTAVGNRLEGVPMHNASAGLTYDDVSGWQASVVLRYISKSFGDAHPEDGLIQNAHFVVDASASYPLSRNIRAFVKAQNLFDKSYIASNGGGAPILGTPFEVMGGLNLKVE
jgi:outer membrane receptor protein involved in Fe transport